MVNNKVQLDIAFQALADNTRRAILSRLAQGDARVSELAEPFDMSLPAVSKHLKVLENAGLISRHKQGRIRRCHLEAGAFQQLTEWLDFYQRFWDTRLDKLSQLLETRE
jgi:DNA-binding transcriptional ArsR family regulator